MIINKNNASFGHQTFARMHVKRLAFLAAAACSLAIAMPAFAQGMMGAYASNQGAVAADAGATAQDEAAGKAVWDRLQSKQATCADLNDGDFDKLGDYFMGLMMGGSHAAMNAAMTARLGDAGETQMHVVMGKRLSGCDASAAYPQQGLGYLPMMRGAYGYGGMMGWAGIGAGGASAWSAPHAGIAVAACVVTLLLVWIFLVLASIALAKWIARQKK